MLSVTKTSVDKRRNQEFFEKGGSPLLTESINARDILDHHVWGAVLLLTALRPLTLDTFTMLPLVLIRCGVANMVR